jgi:hypothetical protein
MEDMHHATKGPDADSQRIRELVIEAGALVDWVAGGRGDMDVVGAALLYLRDELETLAGTAPDEDSCQAACGMVEAIERTLTAAPASRTGNAA